MDSPQYKIVSIFKQLLKSVTLTVIALVIQSLLCCVYQLLPQLQPQTSYQVAACPYRGIQILHQVTENIIAHMQWAHFLVVLAAEKLLKKQIWIFLFWSCLSDLHVDSELSELHLIHFAVARLADQSL